MQRMHGVHARFDVKTACKKMMYAFIPIPFALLKKCTVQVPVSGYAGCGVVGRVAGGEGGVTSPDNTLL